MDWKDTLLDRDRMLGCSLRGKYCFDDVKDVILDACIAQAEISFKAGYGQSILDNDEWCKDGVERGRRGVVEWIDTHSEELNRYWHTLMTDKIAITTEQWQAQKKEWGLDNGKEI